MKLRLTEAAINHVAKMLKQRGKGIGIIVGVRKTGCSGLAYTLEYVDEELSCEYTDNVYHPGFAVYMNPEHKIYFENAILDYVREGLNEGFKFSNAAEEDRCGCGESFRVKQ